MRSLPRQFKLSVFVPLPTTQKDVWEYALEREKQVDVERDAGECLTGDHTNFYVHIYRREFLPYELRAGWMLRLSFDNTAAFYLRSVRFMTPRSL